MEENKNNKDREIKKLISDIQAIAVRNPTEKMTWREIGEMLYNKGWKKTFAEREKFTVTEDDVETAFLVLTNLADEIVDLIDEEKQFVGKVDLASRHLKIYQLYNKFNEDNSNGEYESIWKKFKKLEEK